MARFTTTPWRHYSDLLTVRHQLYLEQKCDNDHSRRHAVDRILAWKLRGGNLPHAVESTALIIDAVLHHESSYLSSKQASSISTFSIRAVYTAALTRFVTGFCDIGRSRTSSSLGPPASMLEIARQIGMPAHFVALRHEATHEEMPALGRLVMVAREGLDWLWDVYWARLEAEDSTVDGVEEDPIEFRKAEIKKVLRGYRTARREELRRGNKGKMEEDVRAEHSGDIGRSTEKATTSVLTILGRAKGSKTSGLADQIFTDVLTEEKLIMPSERNLGTPLDGAYVLWDELLTCLATTRPGFLQRLLYSFMTSLSSTPTAPEVKVDVAREAFLQWVLHIATSDPWEQARRAAGFDAKSFIVKHCCLHPGAWTLKLGHETIEKAADERFRDLWEPLIRSSKMALDSEDSGSGRSEFSLLSLGRVGEVQIQNDAAPDAHMQGISSSENAEDIMPGWQRAVVAPKVPIGMLA